MLRILIIISFLAFYQHKSSGQVRPVAFEDLKVLQARESRPVMILIMTSWCKYCLSMKNTMLRNQEISGILSDSFYVIFLNAEERRNILYAGGIFQFKPSGLNTGVHELAEQLGTINEQLTFPSICFLNEKDEIIYQHQGFLEPHTMTLLLTSILRPGANPIK